MLTFIIFIWAASAMYAMAPIFWIGIFIKIAGIFFEDKKDIKKC